ncbi:MAG: ABC transporter permease subunit [Armatimonadetes bacterium]|nr:ABC transporter permease subunit [Armatimonadota bacterium]
MRNVRAIALKELKSFYVSALGYVVLGCWLLFTGMVFVLMLGDREPTADMEPIFRNCTILLVIVLPLLTMRLLAGERAGDQGIGTIELLLTSPLSEWELVLGKFFATVFYLLGLVLSSLIYTVTLKILGKPDIGPIIGGYVGFMLFSSYILALGILMSALTNSQVVAAVTTIVASLALWLCNWLPETLGKWAGWLKWTSMLSHHEDFWRGVVTFHDCLWFVSFIFFFLFAAKQVIASSKWR